MSTTTLDELPTAQYNPHPAYERKYEDLRALLNECVEDEFREGAHEMLRDASLPRYYRLLLLLDLGRLAQDFHELDYCVREAESQWAMARQASPNGANVTTDATLLMFRYGIDDLKTMWERQIVEAEMERQTAAAEMEDQTGAGAQDQAETRVRSQTVAGVPDRQTTTTVEEDAAEDWEHVEAPKPREHPAGTRRPPSSSPSASTGCRVV